MWSKYCCPLRKYGGLYTASTLTCCVRTAGGVCPPKEVCSNPHTWKHLCYSSGGNIGTGHRCSLSTSYLEYLCLRVFGTASAHSSISTAIGRNTGGTGTIRSIEPKNTASPGSIHIIEPRNTSCTHSCSSIHSSLLYTANILVPSIPVYTISTDNRYEQYRTVTYCQYSQYLHYFCAKTVDSRLRTTTGGSCEYWYCCPRLPMHVLVLFVPE